MICRDHGYKQYKKRNKNQKHFVPMGMTIWSIWIPALKKNGRYMMVHAGMHTKSHKKLGTHTLYTMNIISALWFLYDFICLHYDFMTFQIFSIIFNLFNKIITIKLQYTPNVQKNDTHVQKKDTHVQIMSNKMTPMSKSCPIKWHPCPKKRHQCPNHVQ